MTGRVILSSDSHFVCVCVCVCVCVEGEGGWVFICLRLYAASTWVCVTARCLFVWPTCVGKSCTCVVMARHVFAHMPVLDQTFQHARWPHLVGWNKSLPSC